MTNDSTPYSRYYLFIFFSGELVSGIGMLTAFQCVEGKQLRGIPIKITTEYVKKAKGTVFATSLIDMQRLVVDSEVVIEIVLRNKAGEDVANCSITWIISSKEEKKKKSKWIEFVSYNVMWFVVPARVV